MSYWQQQNLEQRRYEEETTCGLEAHHHMTRLETKLKIGELTQSKFLKGSDFPKPALCTIGNVTKENVAKPSEEKKERGVMYFEEFEKGLVLNATNLKRTATALGSEDTDDWIGKKIVVYYDENVEFGGDLVGGIRLRGAKNQAQTIKELASPHPAKGNFEDLKDDVPF